MVHDAREWRGTHSFRIKNLFDAIARVCVYVSLNEGSV